MKTVSKTYKPIIYFCWLAIPLMHKTGKFWANLAHKNFLRLVADILGTDVGDLEYDR